MNPNDPFYSDQTSQYPQWSPPPPPQFPTNPGQYPQNGQMFPPDGQNFSKKLPHQKFWQWYKQRGKVGKLGIGCLGVLGIFMMCGMCSAMASAGNTTKQPTQVAAISTQAPTTPVSTPTDTPTPQPTPKPTPTETPTPIPTPVPTHAPVEQSPVQQPAQQPAPATTGVNGNPWGYDFNSGNLIYSPNSGFCGYFSCITTFWNGNGYVEECSDGMYGKSGGLSGSCSHHGGNMRPLYSH